MRVAGPDDAPLLFPLFTIFYGEHFHPPTIEAIRDHLSAAEAVDTVLLATVRERPAGFASLRILPQIESYAPHVELSDLFVDEAFRRQGIGTALLRSAEDLARIRGAPRLYVLTGFDNEEAKAFYRGLGFEDHALGMKKSLDSPP
ncbi:MAG TPA: GNAT family N-acetyltransferase [Thermoplasmata archaeon]